ncbi:MAG TPA: ATP-binding cassette domain-containing protein [Mycobacterium sp.]|uniref:sulfate/molybdate ABC transporter ATP-binding protein n=1 Tax=Mycolicibacterium sp. TaxID=2320850 RepID=UPI0025F73461|nr:ATP-binding cassette domain-containing protein [Mycolicibacterium sp.]HPX36107.1 ATP-binding cassette domain-containing protein [Mycobacterium sp.]HQC75720.1 ATP-binding cassette domain-containing protein [Mycobacterium sp.]
MADLDVEATVAERGLDVGFSVAAGEVLAVLGPNGAGKSSIAAVIAGLLHADRAVVRVGDRILTDTGRGISVPVHERRIGLLHQDPLLFPHLSVLGNVEFAARHGGSGSKAGAGGWLEAVGVAELADRKPREISGGQAQRVALARALAADPDVLLLDEPLAGLDVAGAAMARAVLRRALAGGSRPALLITHDLLDVLALADRVLVLDAGRIAETGPVGRVLAAPRSSFGARFAGLNLVRGVLAGPGLLRTDDGQVWHGTEGEDLAAGADVVAVFSPAAVAVYREQPQGSPRNSVRARVVALEISGAVIRVRTGDQTDGMPGLAADVTADAVADLRLAVGEQVWFTVKTQGVALHAANSPAALPQ